MKKFSVGFTIEGRHEVVIEAESAAEAWAKAKGMANRGISVNEIEEAFLGELLDCEEEDPQ